MALHLIKMFVDTGRVGEVSKRIRKMGNNFLLQIQQMSREKADKKLFEKYVKLHLDFTSWYTIPRKIIDFIEPERVDKVMVPLREARLHTEQAFVHSEDFVRHMCDEIAAKENYSCIHCMVLEEMKEYFKTRKLPAEKELKARDKACCIIMDTKGYKVLSGEKAVREIESQLSTTTEIKGMAAYPGKAKGRARIVLDPARAKDFRKGDILITGMTRPAFVPLMEKAAAFVTDIGGLLCHAALVAREMKKPCIIGTQNATKLIKDGEIIEVDADKGTVVRR
jgi:phosphohistidine swiveling domain-containing protein